MCESVAGGQGCNYERDVALAASDAFSVAFQGKHPLLEQIPPASLSR